MGSIYRITARRTNEEYIGSTKHDHPGPRWEQHLYDLRAHRHCNAGLQAAFDADGLDGLEFKVVETEVPQQKLLATERLWQQRGQARLNRVIPGTREHFKRDWWGEIPQGGLF